MLHKFTITADHITCHFQHYQQLKMIQQLEGHIILLGEAKPLFLLFKRCDEMALTNYFQNIQSLLCIFG